MPKATRSLLPQKKKKKQKKQQQYCFIVWAEYDRNSADASEKKTRTCCIDFCLERPMVSREAALALCYLAAVPSDPCVIRGSMRITGMMTCTPEQGEMWNASEDILPTGFDGATHGKVEIKL
jgi:hypothetical protein